MYNCAKPMSLRKKKINFLPVHNSKNPDKNLSKLNSYFSEGVGLRNAPLKKLWLLLTVKSSDVLQGRQRALVPLG